jgi:hypothetical protein
MKRCGYIYNLDFGFLGFVINAEVTKSFKPAICTTTQIYKHDTHREFEKKGDHCRSTVASSST